MRIIGGKFKGKKLLLPIDKKTRPLKDLVKESIFNLLENSNRYKIILKNSSVLDLFSGSGSFGLECISRGVERLIFLENYPNVIKILKKNISSINGDKFCKIIDKNCFDLVSSNIFFNQTFDIIFLDPPFKETGINDLLENIVKKKLLSQDGVIILHRHKNDDIKITNKLNIIDKRFYGVSKIVFCN